MILICTSSSSPPSSSCVAQSFSGQDPGGIRCVSDCQCEALLGSASAVCTCEKDDGTDCPFDDPGGIDDPTVGDDDDGKGKGKDGKDKSKRRLTTTQQRLKKRKSKTQTSGKGGDDDDDDGGITRPPTPTDPSEPDDLPFGALCCDCVCEQKPCACECFGYGDRGDRGGIDGDDDDGGKGKDGKGKDGKDKKRARRHRRLSEVDEEEEIDASHIRSRLSRGFEADATSQEGNGWKSWVYNSIWSSSGDSEDSVDENTDRKLTLLTKRRKKKSNSIKKKKKTSPPTNPPTSSPTIRDRGSLPPTSDRGGACERPPYTCTYVQFHAGDFSCTSRDFCKANTFGYCEIPTRPS
jgi:hypothetical protein